MYFRKVIFGSDAQPLQLQSLFIKLPCIVAKVEGS
jgi:hypothetical protein